MKTCFNANAASFVLVYGDNSIQKQNKWNSFHCFHRPQSVLQQSVLHQRAEQQNGLQLHNCILTFKLYLYPITAGEH